jgi:hypothetical protein
MELDDTMTVNQDEIYTEKFGKDWERISIAEKTDPEQDETMICDETVPYYVSDHSNSHDEVTFISGRRSTALFNEDSDGTDEDMYDRYDRYHLANSRDELMETLLVPSSNYSISVDESCHSDESETSSIVSSLDEVDVSDDDDELIASVERVRKSSTAPHISTQNSIRKDDRPFAQFMEEEGLVEVVRDWKKYPEGSKCEIKADGALWIANEKTHVVISKATLEIMKKLNKSLVIGKYGYAVVGTDFKSLHLKIASSKKHSDFHDLILSGWKGKKDELEILHLNDCSYDFNVENLQWNTHSANLLLKLSKGCPHGNKFHCSTNINGKQEYGTGCCTPVESRHAADVLKINNVKPFHQYLVFSNGLNFKYPSLESLLSRTHLYKNKPTHKGNPFKSTGIITLLDWKHVDAGLKKAVEDSKIPFDSTRDVLVHYHGKKGKGITLMFIMELACYNQHILGQQVRLKLNKGWVEIFKEDFPNNGIHRLILGLKTGDKAKVGRHLVDGIDGKRGKVIEKNN